MKTLKLWAVFDLSWERHLWVKFLFLAPSDNITHFLWRDTLNNKQQKWVTVWLMDFSDGTSEDGFGTYQSCVFVWFFVCFWELFIFWSLFCGHGIWPNYTGLQCLVSSVWWETRVYSFFYTILLHFFIGFEKRGELSFHSGLIGFENGCEKVFGAFSSVLCIDLNSIITSLWNSMYFWFFTFLLFTNC